ncbi:MAG: molybdenum cofactor biosynthesis protein MoaE [Acidimicrobiales bacterium]
MQPPASGLDWFGLSAELLPVDAALRWATRSDCGAEVLFTGTVRDHSEGRPDVTALAYEAYEEQVQPKMAAIAAEARVRWPTVGPIVMLHRIGELAVGDAAVVVVAAAPHRPEAFAAARYCIDTLKAGVPIWKMETWADGADWGSDAAPIQDIRERA